MFNKDKKPQAKKDASEYGSGKSDIKLCPECNAAYFYKSWHHNLREYKDLSESKDIEFKICPADTMKKHGLFEGYVSFENIPRHLKEEIINQIENIGERAYHRDPMDRILEIHSTENRVEVKTSENQLALSVARQVHKAHKDSQLATQLSRGESVARARVWWPKA